MTQTTLDDDELFSEAASEMRADVEEALTAAREALPASEDVWSVGADNVLGVLNALRSALDAEEATEHLRDAKKWYTIGQRAEAFEDASDLEAELEAVEALVEQIAAAHQEVSDLATTLPELRSRLDEVREADADD